MGVKAIDDVIIEIGLHLFSNARNYKIVDSNRNIDNIKSHEL